MGSREEIVAAAAKVMREQGYAHATTKVIAQTAGYSEAMLYKHFRDKTDLLRAVYEEQEETSVARLVELAVDVTDPLDQLRAGSRAFLTECLDPTFRRIALVEAPAGLGWEEWREIDARYALGLVTFGLRNAMDRGVLREQEVDPLAHVLIGAMTEAGMLIANAPDPERARDEVEPALMALLDGLRA